MYTIFFPSSPWHFFIHEKNIYSPCWLLPNVQIEKKYYTHAVTGKNIILWSKNIIGSFGYESALRCCLTIWMSERKKNERIAQPSILLWRKIDDITLNFFLLWLVMEDFLALYLSLCLYCLCINLWKESEWNKNYINHNSVFFHHPCYPLANRIFHFVFSTSHTPCTCSISLCIH